MKTLFWENVTKKIFFGNFNVKIDTSFFLEKHDQKNIFWKFSSKKKNPGTGGCTPPSLLLLCAHRSRGGGTLFSSTEKISVLENVPPPPVPASPLCTLFSSTKKIPVLEMLRTLHTVQYFQLIIPLILPIISILSPNP